MPASTTEIEEFVALFDGDIEAARQALGQFEKSELTVSTDPSPYATGETVIATHNLTKTYKLGKQKITALENVNINIHKGEFVAITGSSGSGKSTLLQMIGCLDKPTSGTVSVEGQETTKLKDSSLSELRQDAIGFIFQSFYLQPFLRLDDNLAVPAMFTDKKKQDINEKVERLLRRVGLSERAKHFPKELSGGQIQRAAIARAMINNPRIILADEPTGNLDSTNSQAIIDLFRTIRDNLGTTIVVVTHNSSIAKQADRVIKLKDGVVS